MYTICILPYDSYSNHQFSLYCVSSRLRKNGPAYIQRLGGAKYPFEIFTLRFGHIWTINFQIDYFNHFWYRKSFTSNWKRVFFVSWFWALNTKIVFEYKKLYLHFYVFVFWVLLIWVLGFCIWHFCIFVFCNFVFLYFPEHPPQRVLNRGSLIPLPTI